MNIPNALTLARIILVPLIVWLIITHEMAAAFVLFLLAGLSDAADGYLAKRFGWHTELGAYLDPIADKALLVSIYVTLGFANHLPVWLVIAVVSRDILIIGAFILSWILSRPVTVYPLLVSKANTLAQLVLASIVLAELGLGLGLEPFVAVASGSRARSPSCLHRVFRAWLNTWRAMSPACAATAQEPSEADQDRRGFAGQDLVTLGQLILDPPHRAAHGAEDFLFSTGGIARTPSALLQWLEVAEQRRHIFCHGRVDMHGPRDHSVGRLGIHHVQEGMHHLVAPDAENSHAEDFPVFGIH